MFFFCQVLQYSRTIVLLKKLTSFSKATMVMRFPAKKNAGCPKAPRDFPPRKDGILYPLLSGCLGTPLPLPQSLYGRTYVRTYGRSRDYYVTTKISRIDRLPNLLSNGAPLAGFARRLRYKPAVAIWQRPFNKINFCLTV